MPCQSATLCVHPKMPRYAQGTPSIRSYITKVTGVTRVVDSFCAPTASAMVLKTLQLERNVPLDQRRFLNSALPDDIIFALMGSQGTSFTGGGTPVGNVFASVRAIVANIGLGAVQNRVAPVPNAEFRANKPLQVLTILLKSGNAGYQHTVAVNGADGNYIKIFDPANRVYNVSQTPTAGFYNYAPGYNSSYRYARMVNTVSISNYLPARLPAAACSTRLVCSAGKLFDIACGCGLSTASPGWLRNVPGCVARPHNAACNKAQVTLLK